MQVVRQQRRYVPRFYRGNFTGLARRSGNRMLMAALRAMDALERRGRR